MLYRLGSTTASMIPALDALHDAGISYYSSAARTCLGSNHVSQNIVINTISPDVLFEEKTTAQVSGDLRVQEDKSETLLNGYQETFDVPFKGLYAEAVQLKAGSLPAGVPASYVRLESAYDVDVGEKQGAKFISIAGGELKKQPYRFNFVK